MCERVGEKGNLIPWTWKRVGFLLYGLTLWKWGYIDGGTDVTMKTNRLIPSIYPHPDLTKKNERKDCIRQMDRCPFQMSARAHLYMVAVIYFLLSGEKWIEKLSAKPANCILAYRSWLWQDFHLPGRWHGTPVQNEDPPFLCRAFFFSSLFLYLHIHTFRSRVDVECRKKWHVERNWSWKGLVTYLYPRLYYSFLFYF